MGPRTDGPPPLKKMILPALFVGGIFYVTFTRTPDTPQQLMLQGEALGTTWTLKVSEEASDTREAQLRGIVQTALSEVDASMSTYRPDSELMQLNDSHLPEPFAASAMLRTVVGEALDVGVKSGGAFDVTVGPLVNAWGFGPDKSQIAPTEETLSALKPKIGQDKLKMTPDGIIKAQPELYIDLSAIAKGYAVDLVVQRLEAAGVQDILMEVGGEIVARGKNPQGHTWRLGIETPSATERQVHHVVALQNTAMATSGDYRQYYEADGKRVSHLIDPRTSQPIEHRLASVTVISERCSTADAWATALSVLGDKEGLQLANELGIKAYFIVRSEDGEFYTQTTDSFDAAQ